MTVGNLPSAAAQSCAAPRRAAPSHKALHFLAQRAARRILPASHSIVDTAVLVRTELPAFNSVAKTVAGRLAIEMAGDADAYDRLQAWLLEAQDAVGSKEANENLDLLLVNSPRTVQGGRAELAQAARTSVQAWLSNPSSFEEQSDAKMVGAIAFGLLQSFAQETGDTFWGYDDQYEQLTARAQAVLGEAVDAAMVRELVDSYLGRA